MEIVSQLARHITRNIVVDGELIEYNYSSEVDSIPTLIIKVAIKSSELTNEEIRRPQIVPCPTGYFIVEGTTQIEIDSGGMEIQEIGSICTSTIQAKPPTFTATFYVVDVFNTRTEANARLMQLIMEKLNK